MALTCLRAVLLVVPVAMTYIKAVLVVPVAITYLIAVLLVVPIATTNFLNPDKGKTISVDFAGIQKPWNTCIIYANITLT